ncbi:MAG: hypothetical protein ACI841_001177 [Planctomycetota bacterium]|jgi:hypothetical protein
MIAIITLISVLTFSLIVIRIATISLTYTGLSRDSAHFQARSAYTGVGFTTAESEHIVNHPVRRRILMTLMLFGNAGIMTAMSSLILTFLTLGESNASLKLKLSTVGGGLVLLWVASVSKWIDRGLSRIVKWGLLRYTTLEVQDYETLLQLKGDYRVSEWIVEPEDWIADKRLEDTRLRSEGLNVLGILRNDSSYEGSPRGKTLVRAGDMLIVYGRVGGLEQLDKRRRGLAGDLEHKRAVVENKAERSEPEDDAQTDS